MGLGPSPTVWIPQHTLGRQESLVPPVLRDLQACFLAEVGKQKPGSQVSVLLCGALKKSFPALETAAITAGSLGSRLPPVIGPGKGSLMEALRPELSVVETGTQNKATLMVSGHADSEREGQADAQGRPRAGLVTHCSLYVPRLPAGRGPLSLAQS